jgi:hypothetical protein
MQKTDHQTGKAKLNAPNLHILIGMLWTWLMCPREPKETYNLLRKIHFKQSFEWKVTTDKYNADMKWMPQNIYRLDR